MKKLFYLSTFLLLSCSDTSNAQESLIKEYLETSSGGVRTDLKIDISSIEVADITVVDSIIILENSFREKIKKAKESIEGFQANIQHASNENDSLDSSDIDNFGKISANKSLIKLYENGLRKTEVLLERLQKEKTAALEKYRDLDKDHLLAKKAVTTFSHFNPKLNARQERTETLILSKNGSEVLGIIYKGKLRSKG